MINTQSTTISLFGASPETGNQGVTALCWSALHGLTQRMPLNITVFDYGQDIRPQCVRIGDKDIPFLLQGVGVGRRFWRPDHQHWMKHVRYPDKTRNPTIQTVKNCAAILDVSGGDSFTDLYGDHRFEMITLPKEAVIRSQVPLILLPQTYGPFKCPQRRARARSVVKHATLAYARDQDSFNNLVELMESDFDVHRHKLGVDLAFLLPFKRPASIYKKLETVLPPGNHSVAGINISGLLYNQPVSAKQRFGLKGNYRNIMEQFLSTFLRTTNAQVILVPHVNRDGIAESDLTACRSLANRLRETDPDKSERLIIIDAPMDPSELKWVIASLDWFCGARMHAAIAALSTGIPTAGMAYSSKFKGVFESCQAHRGLIDLRKSAERDTVESLMASWHNRNRYIHENENHLDQLLSKANLQMDTISQALTSIEPGQCKSGLVN